PNPPAPPPGGGAGRPPRAPPAEANAACRSYLVLLPVGFTLPPPLPAARCALTAPFHPCRPPPRRTYGVGGVFLWHFPWGRPRRALPGTVPPWSPDFPPFAKRTWRRAAIRPSDWEDLGWRAPPVKRGDRASCLTAKGRPPLPARGSGGRPGRSRPGGRPGSAAR